MTSRKQSLKSQISEASTSIASSRSQRVSMRDIAKEMGVSHATVSLALRNHPRISEKLRQDVQNRAREMGYCPDPMLAALSHYRRSKNKAAINAELAWINCWPDPKKLRSFREFDLYWKGAYDEAERAGFRLEEFRMSGDTTASRLQSILRARNIRGILIPPHGSLDIQWGDIKWDEFCIVRFGHSVSNPRAHLVTSDHLTDGIIAVENIWSKGYRRIGYVTTRSSASKGARFTAGFFQGQLKVQAKPQLHPLFLSGENSPKTQLELESWLRKTRPDALLTDNADMHRMLVKAGWLVPKDIGLVTTSVLDGDASAGIDQNSQEIGRAAVQLLISLINHNERGIPKICREVLVEGRWIDGDTLPAKFE